MRPQSSPAKKPLVRVNQAAPPNRKNPKPHRQISVTHQEYFSGPLPPPELLANYEHASPGAASRIIAMAEDQTKHRHELEKAITQANIKNERTGMHFAFLLTLILMAIGGTLIYNDREIIGLLSVFAPVLFHAGNYIYTKRQARKELHEKKAFTEEQHIQPVKKTRTRKST